jgi:cyanate lyase
MSAEQADTVVDLLCLDSEVARALREMPLRGALD